MKIKGSSIIGLYDYMKLYFPEKFEEWINKLPEDSKKIYTSKILVSKMYPIEEAMIIPTQIASELTGKTPEEISFDSSVQGVKDAIKGFLKIVTKINTIAFLFNRAKTFFYSYYDQGKIQILQQKKNKAALLIWDIPKEYKIILWRVYGWMYQVIKTKTKEIISHDIKVIEEQDGKNVRGEIEITWRLK